MRFPAVVLGIAWISALPAVAVAQDTYEIQIYPSETMAPGVTMVELHSNFTLDGQRAVVDSVVPSYHALHETVEITHGFNDWFEVGFYFFTNTVAGDAPAYVGSHIRPRVRVPPSWHWPVGVSISQEIGFQRRRFSEDTWDWEIRPIVDRQAGRLYWSVNPTMGVALKGGSGVDFSPGMTVTYDVTPKVNLGVEYYSAYGTIGHFVATPQQWQEVFPVMNLNLSPDWEFNAGVGWGLTHATDHLIAKVILGRRFPSRHAAATPTGAATR